MKINGFASFMIGISVGAAVTLLFAPKSGKATRRYITRRIDDGREMMERGVEIVRELGEDIQDRGKEAIKRANRTFSAVAKAGSSAASALL